MQLTDLTEFLDKSKFDQDKEEFHLFYKMTGKDSMFLSDNATYCLGRGNEDLPTWVWTEDKKKKKKVKEVEDLLKLHYLVLDENKLTCKKELYEYLKNEVKSKNIDAIELNVWGFNENAIRFYESLGMNIKNIKYEDTNL